MNDSTRAARCAVARRALRTLGTLGALAVLAGCASPGSDRAFETVEATVKSRSGVAPAWGRSDSDRAAIERRVSGLLTQSVTADAAVQIAVLNNRGLQADYFEIGIGDAELAQAGRLRNPGFSMMRTSRGSQVSIDQALTFDLLALITMPRAVAIERQRLDQIQRRAALKTLALIAETRKAWAAAVAAEQGAQYMEQVRAAAEAGAELAERMAKAGNFTKLQQAREQTFRAEALLAVSRATQLRQATRERLIRRLGLSGAQLDFKLPERLPDLPPVSAAPADIERLAGDERLDLQAARADAAALAERLGLTRITGFVDVLELGPARSLDGERGDPWLRGFELRVELPLFDWGTARVAKAEAEYRQALERTAEIAINARSELREAHEAYRAAFDVAQRIRDDVVPLRRLIAEENQLRYNAMQVGVFDLLADARAQVASVNAYVEALRDFWIAQADLDLALVGPPALRGSVSQNVASGLAPEH